jgi:hypothetical protein
MSVKCGAKLIMFADKRIWSGTEPSPTTRRPIKCAFLQFPSDEDLKVASDED